VPFVPLGVVVCFHPLAGHPGLLRVKGVCMRLRRGPYQHWISGLSVELAVFVGFIAALSALALVVRAFFT
jgi:hypothetical protein